MSKPKFDPLEIFFQFEAEMRSGSLSLSAEQAAAIQFRPGIDIYETVSDLVIKMETPGVQPEDLNLMLSADDRILTVTGERRETFEEQKGRIRCHHLEIFYGSFERKIVLPGKMRFDRDHITANYRAGILVISLPKRAEKRSIEVRNYGMPDSEARR